MSFLHKISRLSFSSDSLFLLFVITSFPLEALALTGKVVSVADGDTITILDSSKNHTSGLTFKKTAPVTTYDTDRYGRTVGVVKVGGTNVYLERLVLHLLRP